MKESTRPLPAPREGPKGTTRQRLSPEQAFKAPNPIRPRAVRSLDFKPPTDRSPK